MDRESRLAFGGFVLIAGATVVALRGSNLWWPIAVAGLLLLLGGLNLHRSQSIWYRRNRAIWPRLYAGYLIFGLGQEIAGRWLGVWQYDGLYDTWAAAVLLVLVGYPLFFAVIHETYTALSATWGSTPIAWLGTVTLTFIWSELPNQIAPLYDVLPPFLEYRIIVFGVGYLLQTILAVGWRRRLMGSN